MTALIDCPRCHAANTMAPNEDGAGCATCGYRQYGAGAAEDRRRDEQSRLRGYRVPYVGDEPIRVALEAVVEVVKGDRTRHRPRCPWCNEGLTASGHKSRGDTLLYKCGQGHRPRFVKDGDGQLVGWS